MTIWNTTDFSVNGVRLRTYRGGQGAPVVLVHGLSDNGLYWSQLARELAKSYDVVMYDSRGHGHSEASPDGYTLELLVSDLVALVGQLGMDRPALIGHSMGALTAMMAAGLHPGMFSRVALEDPLWWIQAPPEMIIAIREGFWNGIIAVQQLPREVQLVHCRAESPGWSDEDYELWADSKTQMRTQAVDVLPSFFRDWPAYVRQIDCPLLLLTGDPARGALFTHEAEQELLQQRPDARIVRFEYATHQVRRIWFDGYLDEILQFLV